MHGLCSYSFSLRCVNLLYIKHGIIQTVLLFIIHIVITLQLWDIGDTITLLYRDQCHINYCKWWTLYAIRICNWGMVWISFRCWHRRMRILIILFKCRVLNITLWCMVQTVWLVLEFMFYGSHFYCRVNSITVKYIELILSIVSAANQCSRINTFR